MHRKYVLERLIDRNSFVNVVELGVWKGVTAKHLLNTFPDLVYTGVDLYSVQEDGVEETYVAGENGHEWDHESYFKDMIKYLKHYPNSRLLRKDTVEAAAEFEDRSVDLVFIDASHDYQSVLNDIDAWFPKIRSGGIISGDDYNEKFEGVINAVNERIARPIVIEPGIWFKHVA